MPQASFPSDLFPAFPAVTLDYPEGWEARPVVEAVLAVLDDRGADAFSPNVVVGITRAGRDVTLSTAADALQAEVAALREVAPVDAAQVGFGDAPWFVSEFAYVSEAAGTIMQVVAVAAVGNGPFTDVVRVTGTASPADFEESLPVIRRIIASTRIASA
jgi:hypothetical protein